MKATLLVALLVAFIDYMGVGLIYPLFSSMLFDSSLPLLPPETSQGIRGLWLGILSSVSALALVLSPLCSGSLVGKHPSLPMWVGGIIMLLLTVLGVAVYRRRLFARR